MCVRSEAYVRAGLPEAAPTMGDSNGLGFVITYSGETGVSTVLHWWALGSVMCASASIVRFGIPTRQ